MDTITCYLPSVSIDTCRIKRSGFWKTHNGYLYVAYDRHLTLKLNRDRAYITASLPNIVREENFSGLSYHEIEEALGKISEALGSDILEAHLTRIDFAGTIVVDNPIYQYLQCLLFRPRCIREAIADGVTFIEDIDQAEENRVPIPSINFKTDTISIPQPDYLRPKTIYFKQKRRSQVFYSKMSRFNRYYSTPNNNCLRYELRLERGLKRLLDPKKIPDCGLTVGALLSRPFLRYLADLWYREYGLIYKKDLSSLEFSSFYGKPFEELLQACAVSSIGLDTTLYALKHWGTDRPRRTVGYKKRKILDISNDIRPKSCTLVEEMDELIKLRHERFLEMYADVD